ncbi:protein FAR1-RELATED SEQUENCE 5-like [Vitis riparia]|uniref:protein FAR1-RELATED SEQUENCE 5-like n=1 Tax=Vitis riparia TaxID=96939 RepID=UPI00155A3082|nr:protein FAR1-RELATED SEQUENCE 5-like [Vitis riparia]
MAAWFGVEVFRGNGREGSRTRRGSGMEDRLAHGYFVKIKKKEEEWEWLICGILSNENIEKVMQSVMEKTIKQEFEVKAEDVVNDDAYIGGTYKLGGNGWEEKVLKGISVEEVCKMQFACIDEAETFYNMLAKLTGFSIRKDDLKRDKNGDIISQKWVCSKEGHRATKFIENDNRQREPRSLTRVGCEAAFRIALNRKYGKWIVKEFIGEHNHNLVDPISRKFLRSHRTVSNPDKAQVDVLHQVGVKTTQIIDYMVKQSRGHEHVGFTQKDIYNHVDAMRRSEIKDDESVGTYEWVLETFLDAMMNKKPISVVIDGDKAMRKAIKKVLPDTCHRLCSWHLQRNAFTNVHIKDFSSIFARCMFMRGNEEEFEKIWHGMVANLGLNENRWVTEIYGKRKRWAEAYLRGNFFGGMRTTQRCESMNAYLNRFLKIRLRLYEFVQ